METADLAFIHVRKSVPDAVALEFNESSAIAILRWCIEGVLHINDDGVLELKCYEQPVEEPVTDPHMQGYGYAKSKPNVVTVKDGDYLLFDGLKFYSVSVEEMPIAYTREES